MIEEIKRKQDEIKKIQLELKEKSGEIFKSAFEKIFEENTELQNFSWYQYTPYFNDGETCYFSASTDYININGERIDDCDWYHPTVIKSYGTYNQSSRRYEGKIEEQNPNYNQKLSESVNKIIEILALFDDDFYLHQFGDHTLIKVTRFGIDVSDYEDHD
jgi:hypothetical protein